MTTSTSPPLNHLSSIIAYEQGELDEEQVIELFQSLIDTGLLQSLQGAYHSKAADLISQGLCTL